MGYSIHDRGQANEDAYFRARDAALLEKMREQDKAKGKVPAQVSELSAPKSEEANAAVLEEKSKRQ